MLWEHTKAGLVCQGYFRELRTITLTCKTDSPMLSPANKKFLSNERRVLCAVFVEKSILIHPEELKNAKSEG